MCHIAIKIPGGCNGGNNESLMRVYGLAVVRKEPNQNRAHVVRGGKRRFELATQRSVRADAHRTHIFPKEVDQLPRYPNTQK
jgi:hypothetical protein